MLYCRWNLDPCYRVCRLIILVQLVAIRDAVAIGIGVEGVSTCSRTTATTTT